MGVLSASGVVPLAHVIISQDSVLPSGTIDPVTGDFNPIPGIVDKHGIIPNTRANPPRLRFEGTGDTKEFAAHVHTLLSILDPDIVFAHDFPDFVADYPATSDFSDQTNRDVRVPQFKDTIVWKVTRKEPGSLGDKPFGPNKLWKPRIIERAVVNPLDRDRLIDIYEADLDNIVEFTVISETNSQCEKISDWFYDQIVIFQWFFQKMGIPKVLFLKRTMDSRVDGLPTALNSRNLQYYVRTKRYYEIDNNRIEEIHAKLLAIVNTEKEVADFETGRLEDRLFSKC